MAFTDTRILSIEFNDSLQENLKRAIHVPGVRGPVSVTDLLNPRQAYFRLTRPDISGAPERQQFLQSGNELHARLGEWVAGDAHLERFVEYEQIVGRVDIYDEVPVELKTTTTMPDDVVRDRPMYLDQLGMYCTMTRSQSGRLVVYQRGRLGGPPLIRAFDVVFRDLEAVSRVMVERRDLFRRALELGDPASLGRCEWADLECEFKEICGCSMAHPLPRLVGRELVNISENPQVASAFAVPLSLTATHESQYSLNDLVFPRKAAYSRAGSQDDDSVPVLDLPQTPGFGPGSFQGALFAAMRYGEPGTYSRARVRLRNLKGLVNMYSGVPTIIRSSKFRDVVHPSRMPQAFPHYLDRLAFECALTDVGRGRVIVHYNRLPGGEHFVVYEVAFADLGSVRREAERRLELLESAADPSQMPRCPKWMSDHCDYSPGCGCGE